jgi:hypothetical protein
MTVMYEAINYDSGSGNPRMFGNADSYDVVKSPLLTNPALKQSKQPGNNDVTQSATAVGQSNVNTASSTAQNTAYANNNPIITNSTPNRLTNTIAKGVSASNATANISGIKNISFPINETTVSARALQVKL